ncbi:GPW/gp25 family protein [Flavobacterium chilense]|uniref:Phage baseplate assembly protein W n=1 Tax=Flavobacterium chilense TaxID=946677 RepID=A0A1M6Z432_9FLAO|nr:MULTISPECIES: GPW/gp25 family protein [Flavobacterium]SHL25162.1 Phage baseplate assembly protein W [Flavobacterium chilense]
MKYLKYPVNFKSLLRGSQDNFCKIEESIAYNIMMIITTSFGEIPETPSYGSIIWDLEFNQHIKKRDWEDLVRKSLLKSIAEFEKRLSLSEVSISLDEIDDKELSSSIRRKANIVVKGSIIESLIPFSFHTKLNISPISQ